MGQLTEVRPDGFTACSSCAVVKKLCHQTKELQEEVTRLSSIRDERKKVEWLFSKKLQLQELKLPIVEETGRACACQGV